MLGAIVGDVVGSTREMKNVYEMDFDLLPEGSTFTDDTVFTLAVAKWLTEDPEHTHEYLIKCMQELGRKYINAGFSNRTKAWILSDDPKPYGADTNGSAMRVSPVGIYAKTLEEAMKLAKVTAEVTHNSAKGILWAQVMAACVFQRAHNSKSEPRALIYRLLSDKLDINHLKSFAYLWSDLSMSTVFNSPAWERGTVNKAKADFVHRVQKFDFSCEGTVPMAIDAFILGQGKEEDSIRWAIVMGGDSDTIASMAAAIAMPYGHSGQAKEHSPYDIEYRGDQKNYDSMPIMEQIEAILPEDLRQIMDNFEKMIAQQEIDKMKEKNGQTSQNDSSGQTAQTETNSRTNQNSEAYQTYQQRKAHAPCYSQAYYLCEGNSKAYLEKYVKIKVTRTNGKATKVSLIEGEGLTTPEGGGCSEIVSSTPVTEDLMKLFGITDATQAQDLADAIAERVHPFGADSPKELRKILAAEGITLVRE